MKCAKKFLFFLSGQFSQFIFSEIIGMVFIFPIGFGAVHELGIQVSSEKIF